MNWTCGDFAREVIRLMDVEVVNIKRVVQLSHRKARNRHDT